MGLIGPHHNPGQFPPRDYGSPQNQNRNTSQPNPHHIPMDVDTTTITTQFKRLTPEEQAQLAKEGRCFRCRLQGHMARDCPKNASAQAKARETSTTTPDNTTAPPAESSPNPPPTKKLTCAQQIRALEAEMEEEERAQYMDNRNMGEDFWSAGA